MYTEKNEEIAVRKLTNFVKKSQTLFTEGNSEAKVQTSQTERMEYEETCREGRSIVRFIPMCICLAKAVVRCFSTQPPEDHHKLTCFYWTNNHNPRLVIRPAKVEVVFPEPNIYILHDIISEPEMARLKELAEPKVKFLTCLHVKSVYVYNDFLQLKRAQIRNGFEKGKHSRVRIGKRHKDNVT